MELGHNTNALRCCVSFMFSPVCPPYPHRFLFLSSYFLYLLVSLGRPWVALGSQNETPALLNAKVRSHVDFSWILRVPGKALGVLSNGFGLPWRPWVARGRQKEIQKFEKDRPGAQCVPKASFGVKKERPGPS
jgi:hypothetical protein